MNEQLYVSGRSNHLIDPVLSVWNWEIPVYLFLGGLSAGVLFACALYIIRSKNGDIPEFIKKASMLTPLFLTFGLFVLMLDLKNPFYSWRLYTNFNIESPMSWGAWTLMLVVPLSYVLAILFARDIYKFKWPFEILGKIEDFARSYIKVIAWVLIFFSLILGIYTGILLSAFNARPFWNNPILGPLFLVSGFSAATALIMWFADKKEDIIKFVRYNAWIIVAELFLITHLFMGMLAGTSNQINSVERFLGGEYTYSFFGIDILLGLLTPLILEILYLRGKKIPIVIPALLVIFGGLMFRFMMVEAGQMDTIPF